MNINPDDIKNIKDIESYKIGLKHGGRAVGNGIFAEFQAAAIKVNELGAYLKIQEEAIKALDKENSCE